MSIRPLVSLLAILACLLSLPASALDLVVQADPWCPFNCQPGSSEPGYAIEMLQAVFEGKGIHVVYETVPWVRAVADVREGKASAVVGMSQEQAEKSGLLIGHETVGNVSDCLFVSSSKPLKFARADDMNVLTSVGIVSGYTYDEEFQEWLKRPANQRKIVEQKGENPAEINLMNLAKGRLDGVIENGAVVNRIIAKLNLQGSVVIAGCDRQTAAYVAFSPKLPNAQQFVKDFDDGVAELRRSKRLAKILTSYGQVDWKP